MNRPDGTLASAGPSGPVAWASAGRRRVDAVTQSTEDHRPCCGPSSPSCASPRASTSCRSPSTPTWRDASLIRDEAGTTTVLARPGTLDLEPRWPPSAPPTTGRACRCQRHHRAAVVVGPRCGACSRRPPELPRRQPARAGRPARPHHRHAQPRLAPAARLGAGRERRDRVCRPAERAPAPDRPTYYGRVVRSDGWIVCQYWFFYSFNNWRSGFSGVNEHEADWEQVTVFLDGTGTLDADGLPPRAVGRLLRPRRGRRRPAAPLGRPRPLDRRRPPPRRLRRGRIALGRLPRPATTSSPSHPRRWGGVIPAVRRLAKLFAPWARAAQGAGLGIPYIDYARGDGPSIGPSAELAWDPVVIDERDALGARLPGALGSRHEGPARRRTRARRPSLRAQRHGPAVVGRPRRLGRRSRRSRPARRPRRPSSPTASTRSTSSSPT